MCNGFWREFKAWCKSFTRTELWLSLVQAILLAALIACLTLLILHLLVCPDQNGDNPDIPLTTESQISTSTTNKRSTTLSRNISTKTSVTSTASLPTDLQCTWEPSKKTDATTHYYLTESSKTIQYTDMSSDQFLESDVDSLKYTDNMAADEDDAPEKYKEYVAALVKLKPPADVTFGCILTKVSVHWTLTAASCIESVEEVDSLDSFFIVDSLESMKNSHAVVDVQIHPLYQGANRSYDLAALRSENALMLNTMNLFRLPTVLEYFLVSLGERFIILGYGSYRAIDVSVVGRRVRQVSAYTVSLSQCEDDESAWSVRHLARGTPLAAGACRGGTCGPGPLCAGTLHSQKIPCSYCAGTPLFRDLTLFGVMSDNQQCGVSCGPALYVNIATLRDWIESVIV